MPGFLGKVGGALKQGAKNVAAGKGLAGNKRTALSAFRDWQAKKKEAGGPPSGMIKGGPVAAPQPPQVPSPQSMAPQMTLGGMSPAPAALPQAQATPAPAVGGLQGSFGQVLGGRAPQGIGAPQLDLRLQRQPMYGSGGGFTGFGGQ
jgi:hypothetical protein